MQQMRVIFVKKLLEGYIQGKVVSWARHDLGILACKLATRAQRSFPDFIFFIPGGRPLCIEFKATGAKATQAQADIHQQLRAKGYDVETHDTIEGAKRAILEACIDACIVRKGEWYESLYAKLRALNVRSADRVAPRAVHDGGEKMAQRPRVRGGASGPRNGENSDQPRGLLRRAKSLGQRVEGEGAKSRAKARKAA